MIGGFEFATATARAQVLALFPFAEEGPPVVAALALAPVRSLAGPRARDVRSWLEGACDPASRVAVAGSPGPSAPGPGSGGEAPDPSTSPPGAGAGAGPSNSNPRS
eukprot:tig00000254_g22477.t1